MILTVVASAALYGAFLHQHTPELQYATSATNLRLEAAPITTEWVHRFVETSEQVAASIRVHLA
jgi:N-acetyl-gamma-glutamylphosphate reductase